MSELGLLCRERQAVWQELTTFPALDAYREFTLHSGTQNSVPELEWTNWRLSSDTRISGSFKHVAQGARVVSKVNGVYQFVVRGSRLERAVVVGLSRGFKCT